MDSFRRVGRHGCDVHGNGFMFGSDLDRGLASTGTQSFILRMEYQMIVIAFLLNSSMNWEIVKPNAKATQRKLNAT